MSLKSQFAILPLLLCFTGIVSCGPEDGNPASEKKQNHADHHEHKRGPKHDHKHGQKHKCKHDHKHAHSHDITLKNNICTIVKSKMSDFEVVCPQKIEEIRYGFLNVGEEINVSGAGTDLVIKKIAIDRVSGFTPNHGIEIALLFADGSSELIQTPE